MGLKKLIFVLVFLVAVLAGMGSYAADKEKYGFYVPSPNEEFYGTWVNPDLVNDTIVSFKHRFMIIEQFISE